jgi:hypothetical protein
MSGCPPDGFGAGLKTLPEHQFDGPAGRSGLGSGLAEPGVEQVSFRREFHRLSFAHENPVTCELKPVYILFKY